MNDNYKHLVPMGYYNNVPVYYHLEQRKMKISRGNEVKRQSVSYQTFLLLISIPIITLLSHWVNITNVFYKMIVLALVSLVIFYWSNSFNKNQYKTLHLTDFLVSQENLRQYLEEQKKNNIVIMLLYCTSCLFTIMAIIFYLLFGAFYWVVIFGILLLVFYLLTTNHIYKRQEIVFTMMEELEKGY